MTVKFTNPLKNIKVASPCSASWEEMKGNDRQRFCGQCELNVYNLSAMTITEAESLILNTEGRLCARFYRRPDGTVITKDCPVGLKAVKKRLSKVWTAFASLMITAVGSIGLTTYLSHSNKEQPITGKIVSEPIKGEVEPLMGDVDFDENSNKAFEETPYATMGNVAILEYKDRDSK